MFCCTGDALDSVNKEGITGNIANSAYDESPYSQEHPQVQQRSLTSDSLSSINQRVIARSGQIEDSAYSELLTTTGDPLDSCVLSAEYTQTDTSLRKSLPKAVVDSVDQKVIETIHLASKKSTIEPSSKQKRLLDDYDDEDQDDNDTELVVCHTKELMEANGSIGLFSQQGFEATHKKDKEIYFRCTTRNWR